jgi:hypothetical protein
LAEKTRVNDAGEIEGIDEATGKVLWKQKSKKDPANGLKPLKRGKGRPRNVDQPTHHHIRDAAGRLLWVPKGTNPADIPHTIWPYNHVTANLICELVQQGHTLRSISMIDGYPPIAALNHWIRKYPEFKEELYRARELRALYFEEELIEVARNTKEWTNKQDRLKTDVLKWAAEMNDPNTYAKRTKLVGDSSSPIAFVIDTGIRREDPADQAAIETTGVPVEDDSK